MTKLNVTALENAMVAAGLNQSMLASSLEVSRTIVSQWMKGEKFPRPDKLLRMGVELGLRYNKLVIEEENPNAPVVAFRKKGGCKTRQEHIEKAKDMGLLLEKLVPFETFDKFKRPATLKNPIVDYTYLNEFCKKIRDEIGLGKNDPVDFHHLIKKFNELNAVIIPVLWGEKQNHENAIHIYLPESMTTWIYINLDTNVHDFKFWMAHELGHVYSSPALTGDKAEDFADAFAQTLLFPDELAGKAYGMLKNEDSVAKRINTAIKIADNRTISPNTIIKAVDAYSEARGLASIEWGHGYYGAITNFNKRFKLVSKSLFGDENPTPVEYMKKSEETFKTPFFRILKKYFKQAESSPGFLQNILQMQIMDAKALIKEL